jgi:hypothetical protein
MPLRLTSIVVLLVVALFAAIAASAGPESASACARGYSLFLPVVSDLDCGTVLDFRMTA